MAKVALVKNIFDPNDREEPKEIESGISVRDYIKKEGIDLAVYNSECECYDPETDTWSMELVSDSEESSLNVIVIVNKDESNLDYVIKENDEVVITILPASSDGMSAASTIFGIAAGVFAMVAIGIGSGGVGAAWMAAAVFCEILSVTLALAAMDGSASKKTQRQDDEGENAPSLTGSENQSLIGNPFPVVMGSLEVAPFLIGSPYTDFIVDSSKVATRFGSKQKQSLLLAVGYAPLFINDIKIGNMPLTTNPNNVLSGIISDNLQKGDKFEGNNLKEGVIGSSYKANNFNIEISQFGNHRTLYPYSVKQKNLDIALLYCYDNDYSKIATEHQISWQGATFPTGMRTNSVYFSEAMPYKVAVGIEFPKGLYKEYTDDDGHYIYNKIPMNLVIQWRPVYKYTEYLDEKNPGDDYESSRVYHDSYGYTEKRYGYWRNFDNCTLKTGPYKDPDTGLIREIVPTITYTNGSEYRYRKYKDNEQSGYYVDEGGLYYLQGSYPYGDDVDKVTNWEKKYYAKWYSSYTNFRYMIRYNLLSSYNKNYTVVKDQYISCYSNTYSSSNYASSSSGKYISESEISSSTWSSSGTIADSYFNNQGAYYGHPWLEKEKIESKENLTVAAREVKLNYGLSDGTTSNSNPNWNGVACFSFGRYSCGPNGDLNKDPSVEDCGSFKDIKDAKDSMRFEITANLTQEDILDLINKNPLTNEIGNAVTGGMAKVVTDCIEIRVIRLTPCYIDKIKDKKQHTYSDIVKWTYIKTYSIDKTKLKNDCEEVFYKSGDKQYTKINLLKDESKASGGYNFRDWPIHDYRSKPLNDADQNKLVTIAIECEPDKMGYIKDNLKKISVRASAITPTLRTEYIRYWRQESNEHYYYNSYDTEGLVSINNVPKVIDSEWIHDDNNVLWNRTEKRLLSFGVWYEVMKNEWDYAFFPKFITHQTIVQAKMSPNNNEPERNDNGDIIYDTIEYGNSWTRYIEKEMSRHKSSYGKWIAKEYFLNAFTKQNAIAQILGFMCGQAIGREAKVYNSLSANKHIRMWHAKNGKYYYYDTYYTSLPSWWYLPAKPTSSNIGEWTDTTKEYYDSFKEKYRASVTSEYWSDTLWSWVDIKSSFNMLSVREAYLYTNEIDFKGEDGPIQWNYNLYLTSQKKLADIFKEMLVGGLCYWFYDDKGRYEIHNDKPRYNPVLLITDEDCISSSNTREFKNEIGGYHVVFKDEDNGGKQGEIYVLRGDQNLEHPTKDILELSLSGITNAKQAWAYGAYMLGQSITQREVWTKKLNHIGHSLRIGSLVEVQGSTLMIGTDHSGRIQKLIKDDKYIYGFILDGMYNYRGEYNEDGSNVQGCTLMQSSAEFKSRIVTLSFANKKKQELGIQVEIEGRTITFKNNLGNTNLVLFDKKIVIDKRSLETEDGNGITPTIYDPKVGDVVAFGNVGSITSKAVVYEMSYDNKGKISVSLYPYFESVYYSGGSLPVYKTNLTRKERNGTIPVNESYIEVGASNLVSKDELKETINAIVNVGYDRKPKNPELRYCKADRDGISISLIPINTGSLHDQIMFVEYTITYGTRTPITIHGELDYKYEFDHELFGYLEKEDLSKFKITYRAVNIYNVKAENEHPATVNSDGYGTWILPEPHVEVRESDRTVTLIPSLPPSNVPYYGNIRYKISIRKFDDKNPEGWFKPDLYSNPWDPDNREKYKDPEASDNFESVTGIFIQTLPLRADADGNGFFDTPYEFRIIPYNEKGDSSNSVVVKATAKASSIVDIVNTNKTSESEYVKYLSAISANVGVISSGSITNGDNYWALSDIDEEMSGSREYKKGEFRVGDDDQYIEFVPGDVETGTKGKMNIKANLDVDADFANIKGELNVYPIKDVYFKTTDDTVNPKKKYYKKYTDEEGNDTYILVVYPTDEDLKDYYEVDVVDRIPAFQVKPSEIRKEDNMTAVNGIFRANNEAIFGTSTLDVSYIREFLEIDGTVKIEFVDS